MGDNWELVKLGEIAEIISGKNQKEVENPDGEYPIYGSGGVFGYANEYLCPPGTTVIGRKGTINNPIFVNEKFWNVDTAFGIHPFDKVLPKYLFYFCKGFNFKKLDKSTTIPSLAKRDLFQIDFPLIPLPEQRAIVARIEELFSELDHSIANLKSAQAKLEVFRQAVLKKAFEGGYTEGFREASFNPRNWKVLKLHDIVENLSQGWSPKCLNQASFDPNEWAVIKTSAIQHGKFIEEENKILPKHLEPRIQHEIKVGDILITRAGPRDRVGVCCEVKKTRPKLINCDKVYRLRLKKSVSLSFFMMKMNSVEFLNKLEEIKTGGNDSGVNLTQNRLLDLEIEIPGINEQTQIVQEIESRLSVADKLAETIQNNLEKAEALRQSILKKAFEGKLLSEAEIEACRQEADWEPAERLVEKIKSEKKLKE